MVNHFSPLYRARSSQEAPALHLQLEVAAHRFQRIMGQPLKSWLNHHLPREAQRQLLGGNESVEHIAERLGFADATYSYRFFKGMTGVTPGRFWHREA